MPTLVDKSGVTKIRVDDFAFRKRYSYGTVMVDLESHRIIDLLDSRETGKVEKWLKSYPNIQVIPRWRTDVCFCSGQFPSRGITDQ